MQGGFTTQTGLGNFGSSKHIAAVSDAQDGADLAKLRLQLSGLGRATILQSGQRGGNIGFRGIGAKPQHPGHGFLKRHVVGLLIERGKPAKIWTINKAGPQNAGDRFGGLVGQGNHGGDVSVGALNQQGAALIRPFDLAPDPVRAGLHFNNPAARWGRQPLGCG